MKTNKEKIKNFDKLIFCLYAGGVCLAILSINPRMFRIPTRAQKATQALSLSRPFPFASKGLTPDSAKVTFQDRQSSEHSGFAPNSQLNPKVKMIWKISDQRNSGAFRQESAAVDDSGIYTSINRAFFNGYDLDSHLRWKFRVPKSENVAGTAVLDEKTVYFNTSNGTLYALRKTDGHFLWAIKLGDKLSKSMTLDADGIYVNVGVDQKGHGYLAKISRGTGDVIWQSEWSQCPSLATPTLSPDGKQLFYGGFNGNICSFDALTGTLKWTFQTQGTFDAPAATGNNKVFLNSVSGQVYAIDALTGAKLWMTDLGSPTLSAPSLKLNADGSGVVVLGAEKGFISGIDAKNGTVLWKYSSASIHSPVAVITDFRNSILAWAGCGDNSLCALDSLSGKLIQKYHLSEEVTATPSPLTHSLFVTLDNTGEVIRFNDAQLGNKPL